MLNENKSGIASKFSGKTGILICLLILMLVNAGLLLARKNSAMLTRKTDNRAASIAHLIESRISTNEAVINWKSGTTGKCKVEYGKSEKYGKTVTESSKDLNHETVITSLEPGTNYHYQVTMNTGDTTIISGDRMFTTPIIKPEDPLIIGVVIGYMDVLFDIQDNNVVIGPGGEKALAQLKKDGFTRIRMMEPFARGYMKHFPDLPVQAVKLLVDRGFQVLLCINGSPFINEGSKPEMKWVYRYFPGDDKIGSDDDGGLALHKKRLTRFMDKLQSEGLISHMQFQLFDEPNSARYFWGTFEEWKQLLAANIEVITNPKYGISKSDILCCAFTSNLVLHAKGEKGDRQEPYWDFINSYQSNPQVKDFPFSFHWYPSHGISENAENFRSKDIKINVYPGSYITEYNVTAFMTQAAQMGKKGVSGYRERETFKEKTEDILLFARTNNVKALYVFNLITKKDVPDERGHISTGLFNSQGCPRYEYKKLLEILHQPKDFGTCGDPQKTDF